MYPLAEKQSVFSDFEFLQWLNKNNTIKHSANNGKNSNKVSVGMCVRVCVRLSIYCGIFRLQANDLCESISVDQTIKLTKLYIY